MLWKEEDAELLKGTMLAARIKAERAALEHDFDLISPREPKVPGPSSAATLDEFVI